jgi:hypothetical protein
MHPNLASRTLPLGDGFNTFLAYSYVFGLYEVSWGEGRI